MVRNADHEHLAINTIDRPILQLLSVETASLTRIGTLRTQASGVHQQSSIPNGLVIKDVSESQWQHVTSKVFYYIMHSSTIYRKTQRLEAEVHPTG
jgi:hypothetical protein